MKNPTLENLIIQYAFAMCKRWEWLTISVGYDEEKGYLVSYGSREIINTHEVFLKSSMMFEDFLDTLYGDDSPLFCDDEKYFSIEAPWLIVQGGDTEKG